MARDLRLFYLFRLLSTSYLYVPFAVYFYASRGIGFDEVWLLSFIYSAVVIVTEVPTGILSDRLGRRRTMMAGAAVMVAACTTFYLGQTFAAFAVASGLAALSMTLCSGADSAYLFDLLHDHGLGHEYPRREGTASAWHQAGNSVAFAAGGLLATVNLALPYLAAAGVAAVAFLVALFMRQDRAEVKPREITPSEVARDMRAAFATVWRRKALLWAIVYSAIVFVPLRSTEFAYQPYLDEQSFGLIEIGFIFAGTYLIAAMVARNADPLRQRIAEPILLWGLLVTLAGTFLVLAQISGAAALAVLAIQAIANGLYSPLVKPLIQREVTDSMGRATVLSVESMVRRGAFGLFSLAAWLFFGGKSSVLTFTVIGAIAGVGLVVLVSTRPSRKRPPSLAPPVQVPVPVPAVAPANTNAPVPAVERDQSL